MSWTRNMIAVRFLRACRAILDFTLLKQAWWCCSRSDVRYNRGRILDVIETLTYTSSSEWRGQNAFVVVRSRYVFGMNVVGSCWSQCLLLIRQHYVHSNAVSRPHNTQLVWLRYSLELGLCGVVSSYMYIHAVSSKATIVLGSRCGRFYQVKTNVVLRNSEITTLLRSCYILQVAIVCNESVTRVGYVWLEVLTF